METKKHQVTFQGYLFICIGISLVLAQVSTDAYATTAVTAMDGLVQTTNAGPTTSNTGDPQPTQSSTQDNPSMPSDNPSMPSENPSIPSIPCHLFRCIEYGCDKNESTLNSTNTTCPSYCEMYRHNGSSFESRCNPHCIHHMCNSSEQFECSQHCCNQSGCFNFDGVIHRGNMTMENKTAMPTVMSTVTTTTSTTTTTIPIQYSDKKCRSFICSGTDCYKNQVNTAAKSCQVGRTHCELQKKITNGVVSYEGGCSNTCATSTKSCATITNGDCFQECCNATNTGCCMKLDGQVHFNTAAQFHKGSVLRMFTCAFIVLFLSHYFSSSSHL